jgi:Fur family ferric uptake transcriptional regulator
LRIDWGSLPAFFSLLKLIKIVAKKTRSRLKPSQPSRAELETARTTIREAGLRATPARILTLLAVQASPSPMTHAELADRLAPTGYDKTTAFRNLNDLATAGLLRRQELGDHVYRFEATGSHEENGHPHFLCVDCGSVTCLDSVQITASSRRQSEAVGTVTEILLRGHCVACQ